MSGEKQFGWDWHPKILGDRSRMAMFDTYTAKEKLSRSEQRRFSERDDSRSALVAASEGFTAVFAHLRSANSWANVSVIFMAEKRNFCAE